MTGSARIRAESMRAGRQCTARCLGRSDITDVFVRHNPVFPRLEAYAGNARGWCGSCADPVLHASASGNVVALASPIAPLPMTLHQIEVGVSDDCGGIEPRAVAPGQAVAPRHNVVAVAEARSSRPIGGEVGRLCGRRPAPAVDGVHCIHWTHSRAGALSSPTAAGPGGTAPCAAVRPQSAIPASRRPAARATWNTPYRSRPAAPR